MKSKKASLLHQVITHIILIALVFGLFFLAATANVDSKGVKQQVLEKQIALLIDSADSETKIIVHKSNKYGSITNLEIKEGRVFAYVEGQGISKGYPYFSEYDVILEKDDENYYIKIK